MTIVFDELQQSCASSRRGPVPAGVWRGANRRPTGVLGRLRRGIAAFSIALRNANGLWAPGLGMCQQRVAAVASCILRERWWPIRGDRRPTNLRPRLHRAGTALAGAPGLPARGRADPLPACGDQDSGEYANVREGFIDPPDLEALLEQLRAHDVLLADLARLLVAIGAPAPDHHVPALARDRLRIAKSVASRREWTAMVDAIKRKGGGSRSGSTAVVIVPTRQVRRLEQVAFALTDAPPSGRR